MLFEFDSDQQLWQKTVREVTAKECPPTLVRAVVDSGADPAPLWKTYVGMGWTELADPESAVELAIVVEELGRATDPTPFLATTTQFAPLAGVTGPERAGAAVYEGVKAYRDSTGWVLHGTALRVLDGDRAEQTRRRHRGRRLHRRRRQGCGETQSGLRSGSPRRGSVVRRCAGRGRTPDRDRCRGGAPYRAHRSCTLHSRCVPTCSGSRARSRAQPPAVRCADRLVPGGQAQGDRHARRNRAGPGTGLLRGAHRRRGRSRVAGWRPPWRRRLPGSANRSSSATASSCSARWASPGRTTFSSRSSGRAAEHMLWVRVGAPGADRRGVTVQLVV